MGYNTKQGHALHYRRKECRGKPGELPRPLRRVQDVFRKPQGREKYRRRSAQLFLRYHGCASKWGLSPRVYIKMCIRDRMKTEMVFILLAPVGAKMFSPALPNLEMSG